MRAVVIKEFGPIDSHGLQDLPVPSPGPGEVLINVNAIGVNEDLSRKIGVNGVKKRKFLSLLQIKSVCNRRECEWIAENRREFTPFTPNLGVNRKLWHS